MLNKKINEDSTLLGCTTMSLGECFPAVLKNIDSSPSRVKAEQEEQLTKNKCRGHKCMMSSVSGQPEKMARHGGNNMWHARPLISTL